MERERWSPNYQQSVRMGTERSSGDSKSATETDGDLQTSRIKEDPDGQHIKNEQGPSSVAISEKSRQTIQLILAQIKSLSQNDKYLLYLKLPAEITDIIDPFRQSLNPLGSRSEICRTIVWIKTHLEEDQNISLPKKEVYVEYERYCAKNNIKPLSQADFGKVMKQVFPKVRARRLGQRGNSKYCYSGLRRRISLEPPVLPDLSDKPLSTEAPISESSVAAAWLVIKDWAQQQLGVQFTSLQSLAHYLVRNCFVGGGCDGVAKLSANLEAQSKGDDVGGKNVSKHREMQLQLQKKIQQRSEGKERKRKIQSAKPDTKPGPKKCRSHSVPASGISSVLAQEPNLGGGLTSGECSTASSSCGSNSVSPTQGRTICDKPEFTQLTALPDFNSFHKPAAALTADVPSSTLSVGGGRGDKSTATAVKVEILRLSQPKDSGQANNKSPKGKAKYKSIQPRLQPCDIATYNAPVQAAPVTATTPALADTRSQLVQDEQVNTNVNDKLLENKCVSNLNDCADDEDDFPLTRERLDSVSNVEKDAMDEYLGTNTSQHEEELSKYFNANEDAVMAAPDLDQNSKLSTLRQLLEQNGISDKKSAPISTDPIMALSTPFPSPQLPHLLPAQQFSLMPSLSNTARRRVSFETTIPEDSVPPSPNTRSKNFNFTPISPSSPSGSHSKCSSTSASPFVSPRNTPVPRVKNNAHQNAGIMLGTEGRKHLSVKVKKELDLPLEIPVGEVKGYLPMSAPVSPMLGSSSNKSMLQTLLNANSKVLYKPEYATAQGVPDSTQQQQFFPPDLRSQSAPVTQMQATFASLQTISEEILKQDPFEPDSLESPACDNNNSFNLDMSSNNHAALLEYGLNVINTCPTDPDYVQYTQKVRTAVRSQSMDMDMGFDVNKCRSVTAFPRDLASESGSKQQFQTSSRSYPSTPLNSNGGFVYQGLSGEGGENTSSGGIGFMAGFVEGDDFSIMENGESLVDDNDILMQQSFNGDIN
ncbi:DNA-binding protein RFX7 isoform X2 [Euwallacea fornicatus]|uniref:DNA-binding protein RFX7 isoform X2 n=1 Tax=Euwallacea fornicatus TaxID=995702 RepID=UPI00338EDFA3